jgi:CheY-like chemotaxis protein
VERLQGAAPNAATGRPLRVLLAEDTPANQKVVKAILSRRGHQIDVATTGREAIDLHLRGDYDLILMDVQMPGMDGLQATAAIRASREPDKATIPILAMTAHAMRGDRERCLQAGMDAYLAKPVDAADLVSQVETLAARRAPRACDANGRESMRNGHHLSDLERRPVPAPPVNVTSSSPGDAPIDKRVALDRLGGDEGLFRDFARSVADEVPSMLAELRAALAEGRIDDAHRAAHGLKGMLATLEARPATAAAAEVERLTKAGQPAEAAVARLAGELDRLTEALADSAAVP